MKNIIRKIYHYAKSMPPGTTVRWLLLQSVRRIMFPQARLSFADWGEDRALTHFLPRVGFYVDVGCNDPVSNSNTWLLYTLGWRGLCIDGNEDLVRAHAHVRPRDHARCALISDLDSEVIYTLFANNLVSSIDQEHVSRWQSGTETLRTEKRRTRTLTSVLDEVGVPLNFDFLSVDVEGHDFQVLRSLDFSRYRPYCIVVEIHSLVLANAETNEIVKFLSGKGYRLDGYLAWNAWFRRVGI